MTAAVLLAAVPLSSGGAQAAATVPASSHVYRVLESVTAHYPTTGIPLGVRPQSRTALRTVVEALTARVSADTARDRRVRERALAELASLRAALAETEARVAVRGALLVRTDIADVRPDTIKSNGQGLIDAVRFPLLDLRHGRPRMRGAVIDIMPAVALGVGRWLAVGAQPRLGVLAPPGANAHAQVAMHRLYGRAVVRNVALQVGLEESLWGQSESGALFISGNAAPLPAVSIGTDTAITLPWILRLAGPVTFRGMIADLGRAQRPRHAKLAGWHATMQPVPRFELGVNVTAQQGGEGGPPATLARRIIDLLPLIDALAPQRSDLTFSNKLAGGHLRLRVPEWSGLDVHYELMIDDFDLRRFESTVIDDFSHLLGVRLPLTTERGRIELRAELHNIGLRTYEHGQYLSGTTFRQRLIGSPLGPNAKGGAASVAWESSPSRRAWLRVASDMRDPSLYVTFSTPPFDEDFRIVRASNDPRHRRRGLEVGVSQVVPGGRLDVELGGERAWRDGQRPRTGWVVRVAFGTAALAAF